MATILIDGLQIKMFENMIKKSAHRTVTSKSSSRPKMVKKELIEQAYTDTTGIKTYKSKSQCLPTEKHSRKSIDVRKLAKNVLIQKTPTNTKKSNPSSQQRNKNNKSRKQVIYDNLNTEKHTQLKWSKKNIVKKTESRSVERHRKDWDDSKIPYAWETVLLEYGHLLTKFEQSQVREYKKIYYVGQKAGRRERIEMQESSFDNEEKEYNFIVNDHIAYRFQILGVVGKGSYGQVFRVFDHKKKEEVALKMIKNRSKFTKQAFVEIQILTHIKENDPEGSSNIIKIRDFVIFRKHVCMVFEMMSENLYELIIRNNYNGLSLDLIRRFAIQLLTSIEFLRRHKIIHCDLKPENILLKEYNKSGIKIIDFGSSCFQFETVYTYIQSRYYRAPEITLGIPYNCKIDIWSVGCILGELYTGVPLFPGENENQQMKYFVDTLGLPQEDLLYVGSRSGIFFDKGELRNEIKELKTLEYFSRKMDQRIEDTDFRDFLSQFLRWNPKDRVSPLEALKHKWIKDGMPAHLRNNDVFFKEQQEQEVKTVRISKSKSKEKQGNKLSLNNIHSNKHHYSRV